jgi:hypothetical protein
MINKKIAPETIESIVGQLDDYISMLSANNPTPTAATRRHRRSISGKNYGLVTSVYGAERECRDILPAWVDFDKFTADREDCARKYVLFLRVKSLLNIVSDIYYEASDEVYYDAVDGYDFIRTAAEANVAEAQIQYKKLKTFFKPKQKKMPRQPKKKSCKQQNHSSTRHRKAK